ncbi:unnamed protein product [Ilex paraguariensis]|uniref:Amino acid transporter transmembrane domain-containing protein n=1 Tax=Ilex paraguariensis TaxID=185542 RepID=A0ABC8S3J3_9AQUA
MSFTYASIGSALGLAKIVENGELKGSIGGVPASTKAEKVWTICQALGDIAFAYPFSNIFLEIQDSLRSPPPEKATMRKASTMAIFITTIFYLCCGGFGYGAFGNSTPGNILTGFGFYEPYWLIDFANACVVLHLVGGYQVYNQPVFAFVEKWFAETFPYCGFVYEDHFFKLPSLPAFRLNLLRLCFRTAYVALTTGIAMIFPYFNQVVGLAGAISFWPAVVYFPVEMYLVQKTIGTWTGKWVMLRSFSLVCLVVTCFALVGSIKGLINAKFS